MWKWALGLVALLLALVVGGIAYLSDKIYLRFEHAQLTPADLERIYPPQDLRADFAAATAAIERIHPDFDAIVDRPAYERRKAELMAALDRPMTRTQFYAAISVINGYFRDGHTYFIHPMEEWDEAAARARAPQVSVRIDEEGLLVARGFGAEPVPAGARLLSINGVSAAEIARSLEARESGEGLDVRRAYGAASFAQELWLRDIRGPFDIVYAAQGSDPTRVEDAGVTASEWRTQNGESRAPGALNLALADGVATLTIKSFETPQREYEAFLRDAFERIGAAGATALIIDLRDNGGGGTVQTDLLQSYLSDESLPALDRVSIHATAEIKDVYARILPPEFRWLPLGAVFPMFRGIAEAEDGGVYTFRPEGSRPSRRWLRNGRAFHGPVYVLIGPRTYSSAAIFAAPLQHWGRATLVGQPTGEPMTFFGDRYEFDLPNTHLTASVSHKTFVLFGSRGPSQGIQPDIEAPVDGDAHAAAMADIAMRRR